MKARIVRIGNSIGVIIPKAVSRALAFKAGEQVDVEFEPGSGMLYLSRRPLARIDRAFIREVEEFSRAYDADLRRLAE